MEMRRKRSRRAPPTRPEFQFEERARPIANRPRFTKPPYNGRLRLVAAGVRLDQFISGNHDEEACEDRALNVLRQSHDYVAKTGNADRHVPDRPFRHKRRR